ncbi:hypothetical protein F5878DRAFT_654758 [Lentinula raphanica]|uniref:CxC2-like cysteine cluster KDZ transposase-associated domain-containing protein n=1 Tax=Lentinula raphanica TaxID=153919 RepID=A0AA38NWE7_9AGAR|nr:hypothetical protein F5878DRAFT_654758 [Lentinula raphanica]
MDVDNNFGFTQPDDQSDGESSPPASNIVIDIRDVLSFSRWNSTRHYQDRRSWKQRIQRMSEAWLPLIDHLTDAYISWKYKQEVPEDADSNFGFTIQVVNLYTLQNEEHITRGEDTNAAVALVRAGYLGTAPEQPSLAISLQSLELFQTLRLFKPSLSIEAFAKTICHTYSVPYRRSHRADLSNAFDIYLTIQRNLQKRVAEELGHTSPDYRVLNSCPACCYEVKGCIDFAINPDGNNSLKRMAGIGGRANVDVKTFNDSDYYLTSDFVNVYANEIHSRPSGQMNEEEGPDDEQWEDEGSSGDPTDGARDSSTVKQCTENWKAAASDSQKRMWNVFDESGVFVSACRHGFVLWICDMVRSGELAKYPLAMVGKALKTFGPKRVMGYDIGCTFGGTIVSSSLGEEFKAQDCRTCVNAFHGYSHNALCQQSNHPVNITGMGLEDLETLERLFSSSNQLAAVTRYATPFRRRVFIDMFLQQWDRDKYQNLATMLHNNITQALKIIETDGQALSADLEAKGLNVEDLEAYFQDEFNHTQELGKETEADLHAVAYVELLQEYRDLRRVSPNVTMPLLDFAPKPLHSADYEFRLASESYSQGLSQTRRTETDRRVLCEKRDKVLFDLVQMEVAMGISARWEVTDQPYLETLEYINAHKYQKALERLYKLVVMRLMELHKMNLSFTGYKMRTHISAALQRRSTAAPLLSEMLSNHTITPPHHWSQVTHYSFLDQFNILQDTRHSVLDKPWANPVIRQLMKQHRRVLRAKEEIVRCNVEIRRLHTFIVDEEKHFDQVLERLRETPIYHPVHDFIRRRCAVNRLLLSRLYQTQALPEFTGHQSPGKRKGSVEDSTTVDARDDGSDADDEEAERLGAFVDVIANLTV